MQLTPANDSAILTVAMFRCHSLRQISWQHPSQWHAVTLDGRAVYVRYKWGELTVHVAPSGGDHDDAAGAAPTFEAEVGHRHDSQIDWSDVMAVTGIQVVGAPCPAR